MTDPKLTHASDQLIAYHRSQGRQLGALYEELTKSGMEPEDATEVLVAEVQATETSAALQRVLPEILKLLRGE